jgi:hypothetical protein
MGAAMDTMNGGMNFRTGANPLPGLGGTSPEDLIKKKQFSLLAAKAARKPRSSFFQTKPQAPGTIGSPAPAGEGSGSLLKQKLGE